MKKSFIFVLTVLFFVVSASFVCAETREAEFAMFKRSISPVYNWGKNGLITVPKATTIGKWNFFAGGMAQQSGEIEGDNLYLTSGSIVVGTSSDVEIGYTRRQFIWDNFDRTDLEMDTYHFKARVFHMSDGFLPQAAMGINAVSLKSNDFTNEEDILFNPFLSVTVQIPFYKDKIVLSATGVMEILYSEGESSSAFFSAGADLALFDTFFLIAEAHGINQDNGDPLFNIGAKVKSGWFSLGVAFYNVAQNDIAEARDGNIDSLYFMAYAGVEIPIGDMFRKNK
ncbi:MAG: hypothetical protein CSA18_01210 [Deltaproteobacteria bacterium]|nr:MAG: hypothetical protein CSA18_01210 [Deltaproteobacteria bacterium]